MKNEKLLENVSICLAIDFCSVLQTVCREKFQKCRDDSGKNQNSKKHVKSFVVKSFVTRKKMFMHCVASLKVWHTGLLDLWTKSSINSKNIQNFFLF